MEKTHREALPCWPSSINTTPPVSLVEWFDSTVLSYAALQQAAKGKPKKLHSAPPCGDSTNHCRRLSLCSIDPAFFPFFLLTATLFYCLVVCVCVYVWHRTSAAVDTSHMPTTMIECAHGFDCNTITARKMIKS